MAKRSEASENVTKEYLRFVEMSGDFLIKAIPPLIALVFLSKKIFRSVNKKWKVWTKKS